MVIFLPILNFFKFHGKGERSITLATLLMQDIVNPSIVYEFGLEIVFSKKL